MDAPTYKPAYSFNLELSYLWPASFTYINVKMTLTALLVYIFYKALDVAIIHPYFWALQDLPGPEKVSSYFFGHLPRIIKAPAAFVHKKWVLEYGSTF